MIRSKTFWLTLILVFIALSSTLFMLTSNRNHNTAINQPQQSLNAYMKKAVYTQFNEQGLLHSFLKTPLMRHYQKKNTSYFKSPRLLVYTEERIPWHISARYAKSIDGKNRVDLWDKVKLHQPQVPGHVETTILTQAATVYPDRSIATTQHHATIIQPDSIAKGKGVTANLKTGQVTMQSQSNGIYHVVHEQVENHEPRSNKLRGMRCKACSDSDAPHPTSPLGGEENKVPEASFGVSNDTSIVESHTNKLK